jgi:hypothetical protein
MYDTYESLIDFVTYTATFKWEVDNFENKGK